MIGERIKKIRVHFGLNQEEFGKVLGTSQKAISRWEKNKTEPSIKQLQKLTQLFNINPTWLLTGHGSMFLEIEGEPKDEKEKIIKEFADYLRTQDYEDVKTFWEFVKRWKSKTPSR